MSIGISEEHTGLADSLRGWAASVGGVEAARAAEGDPEARFEDVWKGVVEMGLATIAVPESVGGGGGTTLDQAVALEACAAELVAGIVQVNCVTSVEIPRSIDASSFARPPMNPAKNRARL